jgi:septum formation topological specificity factor MinE
MTHTHVNTYTRTHAGDIKYKDQNFQTQERRVLVVLLYKRSKTSVKDYADRLCRKILLIVKRFVKV